VNLSGTPTGSFADKTVGTNKTVTVSGLALTGPDARNYTPSLPSLSANITATTANVTGLTAVSKVYNGTTVATLSGTASLTGVVAGDAVNLSGTPTGSFADKTVGTNKTVTVSGLALTGPDAGNYTPSLPSLSANITATTANVTGLTAVSRVYNGTTVATLTGTASLAGVVPGDVVNLSGTATGNFADKAVGTNKLVTVSGLSLTGADAGNYTPNLPSLSANITATTANVTGLTAVSKVYDATTVATLTGTASLTGVVPGDAVNLSGTATGSFADKTVGTNKLVTVSGLALTGADAGNYTPSLPSLSANITTTTANVTGLTVVSKVYDATTVATLTGTASLAGVVPGDVVNLSGTATGSFADQTVGTNKTVTVSGLALTGADAGNYRLSVPTLTANITPAPLTVTGITAASKPYDGTTSATIDTVNAILNGVLPADSENVTLVTSGVTGAFADKNVGTGELVTISGLTLGGTAAGNYALTQPTTTADIIPIPPPIVASPTLVGQTFGVSVTTVTGLNYTLEYKNAFTDTAWTAVQTLPGTGGTITLTDRTATNAMRFYRLVTQ
jgi:sorbitol-specific phosphotransferase system component IIA